MAPPTLYSRNRFSQGRQLSLFLSLYSPFHLNIRQSFQTYFFFESQIHPFPKLHYADVFLSSLSVLPSYFKILSLLLFFQPSFPVCVDSVFIAQSKQEPQSNRIKIKSDKVLHS